MRYMTNTLTAAVVLLASNSQTQAGDMTDEQMLNRAVEVISKEDANAKVTPIQAKNPHLEPWVLKNPLPAYRFFCARLNPGKELAAPNRRFLAVKRTGAVIDPFDGTKFTQLLAAEDQAKWKDEDYRDAAILWVHVMSRANEDGWKILGKPEDFTKITFNMGSVVEKQKEAAKQIVPLKIERNAGQANVTFYAWHLIGDRHLWRAVQRLPGCGAAGRAYQAYAEARQGCTRHPGTARRRAVA
jgi:hypothetical protein